ncbi:MAG: hypothetical protein KKF56_01775 [Nanoarchaeota archaeon]|nr:hypothetical protein [Nanoarchaeota archaeon]
MGKIRKVAKWAMPLTPDIERQLDKAMKRKDIRDAYMEAQDPEKFKGVLKDYIEQENAGISRMRKFGLALDTVNKATVPYDSLMDYLNIIGGGLGTGLQAIKTAAMLPGYLAYDAYYLAKTHDIIGTLGNIGYEGLSWLTLGSLPHLHNRYTSQADKYAVKNSSKRFLERLKSKGLEEKLTEPKKDDKDIISIDEVRRERDKDRTRERKVAA